MIIKYSDCDSEFIEKNSHKLFDINGEDWYFFPYWLRKIENGVYEEVPFEKLPTAVKQRISQNRESLNQ